MFIVLEMEHHELVGLRACKHETEAFDILDTWASGEPVTADPDELANEVPGTVAFAGDEVHSVQIVRVDV